MGNSASKQDSGEMNYPKAVNRSATKRRQRNSVHFKAQEPLGIISHPYQQENPNEYEHETSSDEDDHYIQPRGLFKENVSPRDVLPQQENSRSTLSMGSLAYSESTASVSSRQKHISNHGSTSLSEKSKSEGKKGLFARLQKKKRSVREEEIPFEQSLEYAKSKFYGESQEEDDFSDEEDFDDLGGEETFSNGSKHRYRHQPRNSFPPRPYHTRHGSMNGGHNISVFMDEKRLPTIPDVSYQSSTAEYEEAEDDVQDVSNLLGDLVEHDYQEEETSILSKEYTVETEEAKDLPSSYSEVKKECNTTNGTEYIKTMNSMLDKQHASYVEGQEPLQDIEMPRQNLGTIFASVNLTLNDTMNGSKYKSLDDSHASDVLEDSAVVDSFYKNDKTLGNNELQESKDDRFHSQYLAQTSNQVHVKISANEKDPNKELGDGGSNSVHSEMPSCELSDSRKKDTYANDEPDLLHNAQIVDNLNERSAEESSIDDSICNSKRGEISDILSESTVDRSKTDWSLFQGNNACNNDELSESSEEEENIIGCTGHDVLNRTDMTIRHSFAVKSMSNEANFKILEEMADEELSEESAGTILEELNRRSTTVATDVGKQDYDREERQPSPYPEKDINAPTTSSAVNMLPTLSHNDEDEEDLTFGYKSRNQMEDQVVITEKQDHDRVDVKKVNMSTFPDKRGNEYKGPELGTVIELIKLVRNEVVVQGNFPNDDFRESSASGQKKVAGKVAYSRQVAKNAVFLFSDQNVRREQPRGTSKVDQERLTLLSKEKDVSKEVLLTEAPCRITSSDSVESIMEKLRLIKVENRKAFSSKRNQPSVKISKTDRELRVDGIARPQSSISLPKEVRDDHINDITSQLKSNLSIESSVRSTRKTESRIGGSKRPGDDAISKEESFMSTKKNKTDSQLSVSHGTSCDINLTRIQDYDDEESGHSVTSDDISISELQNRHSAITPMKNPKSPYIRFKKAMRMFGKHESKPSNSKQTRKTPPKRNASATKDDIIVIKKKSGNMLSGNDTQNSTKKKRRLTSGIDVIAPRKPTLINPMFRKEAFNSEMANNLEDKPHICSDSVQNNYEMMTTEPDASQVVQPDSPYDERDELHFAGTNTDDRNSPKSASSAHDDFDEILKASSMESPSSSTSIDDFEQLLHNSLDHSANKSPQSSLDNEEPSGLRSAMKQKRGDQNTSNRVSWFGGIPRESPGTESNLNRRLENCFAQSPDVETTRDDKASSKRTRMSSFQIYSPARESLASHSPTIAFSKSIKAPVNPTQMNMHSPCFEPETHATNEESVASFSPVLGNSTYERSATLPSKGEAAMENGGIVLSPVTGRRTPSQNKKWTTGMTPTKNWRQLKAEQDAKKKNSNKKRKNRFSGPLKPFNY
jgi:hypothetical protein